MSPHPRLEKLVLDAPRGVASRIRLLCYRLMGLRMGRGNRMEGGGRVRRCPQIEIGSYNAFSQGCWLWPMPTEGDLKSLRIRIGNGNYFNRNVMIDACGLVEIGDENMFGPDIYITDSNHRLAAGVSAKDLPMVVGSVHIGNRCWIGAGAIVLSGVELGDGCIVGAGSVVTRSVDAGETVAGVPARPIATTLQR
jgi:acetyltransferase-like isoleucine patch superfamily enzyme